MNESLHYDRCAPQQEGDQRNVSNIILCSNISTNISNKIINNEYGDIDLATMTLVCLMAAISMLGIFGNVILLLRLVKKLKMDLRARFVIGTVCSSLMMAIIFQPINILHLLLPEEFSANHRLCIVSFALRGICVLCHISSVCVSSVWNYIYICYPMRGWKWLSWKRIIAVNAALWIIIIINILGIYIGYVAKSFQFIKGCDFIYLEVPVGFLAGTVYGIMVPLLLITMGVNIKIIIIARRHLHSIEKCTPSMTSLDAFSTMNVQTTDIQITDGNLVQTRKTGTLRRRWRQNKTHVIFLLATVIFWIPCLIGASMVVISNAFSIHALKKYLLFALIGVGFGSSTIVTLIEFRKDLIVISPCIAAAPEL